MEYSVNSKTIMADYVSLLVVIKIRFGSIAGKSIGGRISRRVGLKQGPRTNSYREAASIASIFSSRGQEPSFLRYKQLNLV
jgi:hypothetical protein